MPTEGRSCTVRTRTHRLSDSTALEPADYHRLTDRQHAIHRQGDKVREQMLATTGIQVRRQCFHTPEFGASLQRTSGQWYPRPAVLWAAEWTHQVDGEFVGGS